jgi:hypothetical protein
MWQSSFVRAWEQRTHRQSKNSEIMEEIVPVVYITAVLYALPIVYPVSDRTKRDSLI